MQVKKGNIPKTLTEVAESLGEDEFVEFKEPDAFKKARSLVEVARRKGIRLSARKLGEDYYVVRRAK